MFILNQAFKFLKLLHSETGTGQLACGFVTGMFLGFTPFATLFQLFYWICLFCFRINLAAALLFAAVAKPVAFLLDPFFDRLGGNLLRVDALEPLWMSLFNSPVVPYTSFYNTIVMGSFVTSTVLALPLYFLSRFLIVKYRVIVVTRFKATWLFRTWMSSKLYPLYVKYTEFKNL